MKIKGIILISILILTACKQNNDDKNVAQQENGLPQEVQAETQEVKDFSEIGFKLMETETVGDLKMGLTTKEVEKLIGKPSEITPFELWEADGFEHQARVYQQETIELDFIKLEDGRIVSNMITITEGCKYKTARNIGIGSTYDEVLQAYNAEISTPENTSTLIAGTIYGGIIFQFSEENKVNNIFIGAGAE
ncbi:MAG: hypothetical protein HC803_10725 [Saprospiraceae bacterium]|nr:hypothetical protein [Saprospiraceae bacterium]